MLFFCYCTADLVLCWKWNKFYIIITAQHIHTKCIPLTLYITTISAQSMVMHWLETHTYLTLPGYETCTKHGYQSETHDMPTSLGLWDLHETLSLVRETHSSRTLSTWPTPKACQKCMLLLYSHRGAHPNTTPTYVTSIPQTRDYLTKLLFP